MLGGKKAELVKRFKADIEKRQGCHAIAITVSESGAVGIDSIASTLAIVCAAGGLLLKARSDSSLSYEQKTMIKSALAELAMDGDFAH